MTRNPASVNIPIPMSEDLREASPKMCTRREAKGRKSRFKSPSWVDINVVPSGRIAEIGDDVGKTSDKHVESDKRKNVELAPESEIAVLDEGVVEDKGKSIISVELGKTADNMLTDRGYSTTRIPYLGRSHFVVRPPEGLAAVAVITCPSDGFLQASQE
jgi:hypothetical protein